MKRMIPTGKIAPLSRWGRQWLDGPAVDLQARDNLQSPYPTPSWKARREPALSEEKSLPFFLLQNV